MTYLIGVLCVLSPALGASAAVLLTVLLAARTRLHRFATRILREDELRAQPGLLRACAAGAVMSTAATWLLACLMLIAIAPQQTLWFLPVGVSCMALAAGIGALLARNSQAVATAPAAEKSPNSRALRLREGLIVALLLSVVMAAVSAAQQRFGNVGLFTAVALAALADAHAPVASLTALAASQEIGPERLSLGVLLAVGSNSLTRSITAMFAGGWRFGAIVIAALVSTLALAGTLRWAILIALA